MKRDRVFTDPARGGAAEFTFDNSVAAVFDDMLHRSVPGYGTMLSLIAVICRRYSRPDTVLYDLGSSLGGAAFALAANNFHACPIYAVDTSSAMIAGLRKRIAEHDRADTIIPVHADISELAMEECSLTVMNLTLQFIPVANRAPLLKKIADATVGGGAFVLTEKTADHSQGECMTALYYDFKRANGYDDLEISRKRTALENVLIPEEEQTHLDRLYDAGFSRVERIFQSFTFRTYLAWK
ncbi:MAG: carboxy-S-adenosyl-L-methionine synthase CmoA [Fibrobacterota bacterium]